MLPPKRTLADLPLAVIWSPVMLRENSARTHKKTAMNALSLLFRPGLNSCAIHGFTTIHGCVIGLFKLGRMQQRLVSGVGRLCSVVGGPY
jgi:hypothetical protein